MGETMTKFYVSSGNLKKEIEADTPLDACVRVIQQSLAGDSLGRIMMVSDKGFQGDRNPWYVATEVAIREAGHKLEKIP